MPIRIPAYGAGGYLGQTTPHGVTNPLDLDEYGALIPDWARESMAPQQAPRGGGSRGRQPRQPNPLAELLMGGGGSPEAVVDPRRNGSVEVAPPNPAGAKGIEGLPEPPVQGRPQADYNELARLFGVTPGAIQAMDTARSQARMATVDPTDPYNVAKHQMDLQNAANAAAVFGSAPAVGQRLITREEAADLDRRKKLADVLGTAQGQLTPEFEQAGHIVNKRAGGLAYEQGYGTAAGKIGAELTPEGEQAAQEASAREIAKATAGTRLEHQWGEETLKRLGGLEHLLGVEKPGEPSQNGGIPAQQLKPSINAKGQVSFTSIPTPAQTLAQQHSAAISLKEYPKLYDIIDTLDKQGQLGPVQSRKNTALTTTGLDAWLMNPQSAKNWTDFKGMLSLIKSNAAMVHGGARGGGSPEIAKRFDELVNPNMSAQALRGGLNAFERWMTQYANAKSSGDLDKADQELGVSPSGIRQTAASPNYLSGPGWEAPR